jgi:hypothetical protein
VTVAAPAGSERPGLVARLGRSHREGRLVPVVVLTAGLVAASVWLLLQARGLYFYSDDWDFLLHRGSIPRTPSDVLSPHNGHWSTGVILAYLLLFAMFGLHLYWPWVLVNLLLHLGVCFSLYVVLRRCQVSPWPAVAVVAFLVGSGQTGSLVQASAMNHFASVLAGLLALRALLRWEGQPGIARAWGWLVAALACSSVGVTLTLCAAAFALLTRGWRAAFRVAVVPALVYAGWYLVWGRSGNGDSALRSGDPRRVADFVGTGLTTPLSLGDHWVGVVVAVLLALLTIVANVLRRGGSRALRSLALAGWLAAAAQLVLIALTPRLDFGLQTAGEGRYGYVTLVLVLPSFALVLSLVARPAVPRVLRAVTALAVIALLVAWTAAGVPVARRYADGLRTVSTGGPDRIVALAAAVDAGERVLTPQPSDVYDQWFDAHLVTDPAIATDLPRGTVDPQDQVAVEAEFMTAVSTAEQHLLFHTTVTGDGFVPDIKPTAGCGRYVAAAAGASLSMPSLTGVEFGFHGPATAVTTEILRNGLGGSRTHRVKPGTSYFVATSAKLATFVVTFNRAGHYRICTA